MPRKQTEAATRTRKSRVAEMAENLKIVAGDTVKEAVQAAKGTVKQTGEKINTVTEKTAKAPAKKPRKKGPAVVIQSIMGGEITVDEILARIETQINEQKVTSVYIKAEENRAYYVAGDEGGYIELWQ